MYDSFNRRITYLRISVTDKCNLRCRYCMPEEGVPIRRHQDYLSFEQITAVVQAAVRLGVTKVRLTGGEPLVKRGIVELVGMIRGVEGLQILAMSTNGILLPRYAGPLKAAGLDSLNISLDTLDPERYRRITRIGDIRHTLAGIDAAVAEGFPVKINMVVLEDTSKSEIERMRRFCTQKGAKLQLINHYDLSAEKSDDYRYDRPPRCEECNRIRLLADGILKPCLHSDLEIPVDFNDIEASLLETVARKPARGMICTVRSMMEIGG
jgi:cyclic pyranopterin phosphate synthase